MKRFARFIGLALAGVLVFGTVTAFGENGENDYDENDNGYGYEDYDDNMEADAHEENGSDNAPALGSFIFRSGEVTEIRPFYRDEEPVYGEYFIHIEGEEGTTVFRTDYNTFVLGNAIEVGDVITGYFPVGPMILIYPPQFLAHVIVNGEFDNVRVARFFLDDDGNLDTVDGMFRLNFTDETAIYLQDGRDFRADIEEWDGELMNELNGRLLVVVYGPTTRGIPEMTIPGEDGSNVEIYVLFERIATGPADIGFGAAVDLDEQVEDPNLMEWTVNEIVVNGEIIEANWQRVDGVYFVPFRAVINALGFGDTITWDGETRTITVNNGTHDIRFVVGEDNYYVDNLRIGHFGFPSALIDSTTYVPIRFFTQVFGMNNAYMHEGQIVIDNEEVME